MFNRLFRQTDIPLEYRSHFTHLYFDIGWFGVLSGSAINFLNVYAARLGASGFQIGMDMPEKLQPGPLAGQISFFAPVSLFLFFFLLFIITIVELPALLVLGFWFVGQLLGALRALQDQLRGLDLARPAGHRGRASRRSAGGVERVREYPLESAHPRPRTCDTDRLGRARVHSDRRADRQSRGEPAG